LHGAPVTTFDLDVVHKRTPENLEHLMSALQELDAYYRGQFGRKLKPDLFNLNLETLIAIKEEVLRDTDKAMLPILRRTLEEKLKMDR